MNNSIFQSNVLISLGLILSQQFNTSGGFQLKIYSSFLCLIAIFLAIKGLKELIN